MSDHPKYGDMMRISLGGTARLMMYVGPDVTPPVDDRFATYVVILAESSTIYPEGHVNQWYLPEHVSSGRCKWIEND